MACVGCQFTLHEQVTGVQFAARERGSRIILWLRTTDPTLLPSIKEDFLRALHDGLPDMPAISLAFDNFAEKKAKSSTPRPPRSSTGDRDYGGRDGGAGGYRGGNDRDGHRGGDRDGHRGGFRGGRGGGGGRYFG
jgi:hypothetical protein